MDKTSTRINVPICQKYCLTIPQAVEYFGIGESRLRQIVNENINNNTSNNFILQNGNKILIKRKLFENFLDACTSI